MKYQDVVYSSEIWNVMRDRSDRGGQAEDKVKQAAACVGRWWVVK